MKRLDKIHAFSIAVVVVLSALFFTRPRPEQAPAPAPLASSSPVAAPTAVPLPSLPSLDGGRGGISVQVNLAEGTYDFLVDPPPPPHDRSSAIGVKPREGRVNLRLAP